METRRQRGKGYYFKGRKKKKKEGSERRKDSNSKTEGKYVRKVDIELEHAYRGYINNNYRNHQFTRNKRFHFLEKKNIYTLI